MFGGICPGNSHLILSEASELNNVKIVYLKMGIESCHWAPKGLRCFDMESVSRSHMCLLLFGKK